MQLGSMETVPEAEDEGDFTLFEELRGVLAEPYKDVRPAYRHSPRERERVRQTFCGT